MARTTKADLVSDNERLGHQNNILDIALQDHVLGRMTRIAFEVADGHENVSVEILGSRLLGPAGGYVIVIEKQETATHVSAHYLDDLRKTRERLSLMSDGLDNPEIAAYSAAIERAFAARAAAYEVDRQKQADSKG